MSMVISGDNGLTFPAGSTQVQAGNFQTMVNRIINGNMTIDQRNAGAAVTVDGGASYGVDRWKGEDGTDGVFTIQQSSTAPAGFNYSTKITITTADASLGATQYSYFGQVIEGYNFADLGWGTASAKTVTLSFWVQASVTGTYTASFINSDQNRCYPATFTISAANTWEYKTITVAGDTTGTWLTTNGAGLKLYICMGTGSTYTGTGNAWTSSLYFNATGSVNLIGTLNATFYITGVDLRVGSYTVVPQDFRSYGTELALCQRYYQNSYNVGNATSSTANENVVTTTAWSDGNAPWQGMFVVNMRSAPTVTLRAKGSTTTGQITSSGTARSASADYISNKTVGYIGVTSGTANGYSQYMFELSSEL